MPDRATIESIAGRFEAWATSLSPEEQQALAEWWESSRDADVSGHSSAEWWQQPGAWSQAWVESW